MPALSRSAEVAALLALALFAGLWLYGGPQAPLTPAEIDAYMAAIEAQTAKPGGRHDLPALRRFFEEDDGAPFYTVNLYDYWDVAHYEADGADARTQAPHIGGREAFDRFTAVMLPLLARQASHPVFATSWSYPFETHWDRLVIVRYRSRRDIAEVFANDAFAEGSAHKWAALERHERMLVQGRQVPELALPLTLLGSGALAFAITRQRAHRRETAHDEDGVSPRC